ncbi:His Kinase A (phospho-acceptor) domain-containing protein [Paenibacillus sp. UNCCL117]|uniref:sensor histidine kinase n=1 Tax=unclassified Paenibacillus TaxID=185978 RepID=UPI0008900CFC|nr:MULTISPECIES: response regulator [unclassified Paenibacillus]SDC67730.1 His Kinase A (phospho-acceptor) domain-containing protein [Paenibacillus sp. cl123]SFW23408.1 His Kinase A (phospho-acceptor) domain-containing protein [Paenibacillus sp. UNCCL117]
MNHGLERQQSKILVVDDRRENLYAMDKILRTLPCEVHAAYSGNEALSLTLRHDFALILLDVNMPEMDGFELAELLRSNKDTQRIPIIFVTAINTEDKSVFKGYESGAVDYLFKPVDVDILLSKVKVFLELNRKQKELELIQSELERSNRSLAEFAQVVSHDLKNPLHVITGLSELLLLKYAEGMNERCRSSIEQIASSARRMDRLITDMLAFARVDAQAMAYDLVDLNEVLQDVVSDLSSRLEETGGEVVKLDELPRLEADRTQMYQLFQNLLANAIKYHAKGRPPRIAIGTIRLASPDVCCFYVEDNGMGMEEAELPTIFNPLTRLGNAKGLEGVGLGLATVRQIIQRHQGSVEVTSKPGVGTRFKIAFPVTSR